MSYIVLRFLLIFLFISGCGLSPGFQKEPTGKKAKDIGLEQNGVSLLFHNLNKMNIASLPKVGDIKKKLK